MFVVFASCSKDDDIDLGDLDNKGKFELTISGKKYSGTEVASMALAGKRSLIAKNDKVKLSVMMDESNFKSSKSFDLSGSDVTLTLEMDVDNDGLLDTYMSGKGTFKVSSSSKVEVNGTFYKNGVSSSKSCTVVGYASTK
jgi:hypothetical protein